MNRTRRALASSVLLGSMTLGLSACGQGSPAVCADMDQLRRSVASLKDIQLDQGALSELSSRLKTIQTDARQLQADASKEFADETAAVTKAGDALGVGIDQAMANPSIATLSALKPQVTALGTALGNLSDALSSTC
ncbi:hypothetical protein KRR39_12540 [Nocardioides panacis]|uniref:Uncharacterized protein n=1 Tax=Nocardioides panacis TaxID=2849501 RepID=A0A975XYP2_9ACTN|nr:hypothetical protein [Nocardioides panacis]QWZ06424.1 hypothetical protein KRR39_12540 [Nocardioides panacis]